MTTPSQAARTGGPTVRIGALAPLSRPGWSEAGRHLLAGLELGVREVNDDGGITGRPVELLVRDTAADPRGAEAAVTELAGLGVAALVGEYHSVAARAAATRAAALGIPFLCSSSVLDALVDEPTDLVARIAPPQSRGWRIYGDFLLDAGHDRVAVATQPSVYWTAGTRLLREHLEPRGGTITELDMSAHTPAALCDALADDGATALLLLLGHPDPVLPVVGAVRRDPRLAGVTLGAPAGQPEFADWAEALGADGAGVPFLRYLPERFGPLGERVGADLRTRLAAAPSFVAFEGYDTIAALADVLRENTGDPADGRVSWSRADVEGTRGRIRFTRPAGSGVWQWAHPPVQVVDRDPARPGGFRVLRTG
ncbi:ABC transporter substrate-binding protein [Streptomyces parvulus]|uniref:ABC transporter substrate-binding protein n=1 Tax=Streptomyces parvulus TaxID=146923 RepID=UPI0037A2E707